MTGATGNIYCGLHEYVDMSFVLHVLRPGDLFVDIGANIGSYSVLASKVCGASVIAIEPDPDTAKHLYRNFQINDVLDVSEIAETALGASRGTVSFTIGLDTTNKVADGADKDVRTAPLTTLDSLLEKRRPRVIKMDVEGYEAEVLKGAEKTLECPDLLAIISESGQPEVVDKLKDRGFEQFFYDPASKELGDQQAFHKSNNSLFIRISAKEKISKILTSCELRKFRGGPV